MADREARRRVIETLSRKTETYRVTAPAESQPNLDEVLLWGREMIEKAPAYCVERTSTAETSPDEEAPLAPLRTALSLATTLPKARRLCEGAALSAVFGCRHRIVGGKPVGGTILVRRHIVCAR